ncbi:WcaF family extracellular polysaccharide biosynthesis acetyltransferase [Arthrobacter sp. 4R501]|uniref:WcaF family extracellular polysaccharide biosynthesis acetyltransferase n=1 Tax=Arthrobacter sp. 4R501 TaxID=2058886 RepID=UPI000CE502C1|nr:WcaF family extracellular polysaccharide biosynthesis acetyltransferase [Arthrobacter sp. 4R501]
MERCNYSITEEAGETVDLSRFSGQGLDRGRSRLVEILWWIAKLSIVQTRAPWPSSVRRAVLRLFGANIGQGFYIRPSVNVHFPWKLTIGDNVWIGEGCTILNLEPIVIRSNTAIAHEVYITSGGHDISSRDFAYENKPVLIESGVWLGTRSFVGAGVTVHRGAVVAAGAVVVKDVPEWAIVGGTPARVIGTRKMERSKK